MGLNVPNGLRWTCDDISDIDFQSDECDHMTILLYT